MSKKIKYGYNGGHSDDCPYTGDEALAYARMEVVENTFVHISATEVAYYDKLLESAQNDDKDISIDTETVERLPFSIVYGGMYIADRVTEKFKDNTAEMLLDIEKSINKCSVEGNDGYEIITIDENYKNMVASSIHMIYILKDAKYRKGSNFYPFYALVQTDKEINSSAGPTTFFMYESQYNNLWENMINRPFLFAVRMKAELPHAVLAKDDIGYIFRYWGKYVSIADLMDAYQRADLVDIDEDELLMELEELDDE